MYSERTVELEGLLGPRRLARLMDLYESNYRQLMRIAPAVRELEGVAVSSLPDDLDLHLETIEQTRYTTCLRLTYYFPDASGELEPDPAVTVRLFHDARVAEVLSCRGHPRHRALAGFRALPGEQIRRRWPRNLLLAKWLEFCTEQGHSFTPVRGLVEPA